MNSSSAAACLASADEAFGPVVQTCRDGFDFTLTFEHYIFTLLPAALAGLVAGPFRLAHLGKAPPSVPHGQGFRLLKVGVVAGLASLQLALAVLWASSLAAGPLRTSAVAASAVSLAASVVFCVLSYAEHAKSVRPSMILNAYLLLSVLLDAATLRSLWLSPSPSLAIKAVFSASFASKIVVLMLEAKEKTRWIGGGRETTDQDHSSRPSPEETSGLYGQAMIWWITPLMKMGFRRLLKPLDLFALDRDMAAATLDERFRRSWLASRPGAKYRLIGVCARALGAWSLLGAVAARLARLAFTVCQPLVLNRFLEFLSEDPDESGGSRTGYALVGAYGLVYFGIAASSSLYWHRACRMTTMLRGLLVSAIYDHTTQLPISSDNSAAVTLMSTDVEAITRAVRDIHEVWANILQVSIATWLLSRHIGFAAAGPVIASLLTLTICLFLFPSTRKYMVGWVQMVQKRISITSSMLGHMKSIKMSGLSARLNDIIADLRRQELKSAVPFRVVVTVASAVAQIPNLMSPVVAFAIFTAVASRTGDRLDSTRMFSALSLIILMSSPLFLLMETMMELSACAGLFKRIQDYLEKPGREDGREIGNLEGSEVICLEGVSLSWSDDVPVVSQVDLSVKRSQLVALVGPVAAGKSTLLRGILGEVPQTKGTVRIVSEPVSWCDQTPWIINGTIRQNITAFAQFDQARYDAVLKACDLKKDLDQLPSGDESVVGSKGIALSGGQKQRVALARALYSLPKVALFDDVFSGLDNHTANTVFRHVFSPEGFLRQNGISTVIATQSSRLLRSADAIVALKDGKVVEQGTYSDLAKNSDSYVSGLLALQREAGDDFDSEDTSQPSGSNPDERGKESATGKTKSSDEIEDLTRQLGDMKIYKYYFGSIGPLLLVGLFAMEMIYATFSAFPTVWLKFWADSNADADSANYRVGYYLGIYTALQLGALLSFLFLMGLVLIVIAGKSGFNLHQRLLDTVMNARLSLFTGTDTGSITTRFSQDIGLLDRNLPLAVVMTLAGFFDSIARAVLVASASWYIAISFPALVFLFYKLQQAYLRTSRQLRHLDLEEKAPLYAQFLETIAGLATIRAYSHTAESVRANHALVDRSQKPYYLLLMIQKWLALVLDLTVMAMALLVTSLAVRLRTDVNVGMAGVSLVQLISLAEALKLLIQFWTSLETSLGAVARIKGFAEQTAAEEDENPAGNRDDQAPPPHVPDNWPARGHVEINDLTVSYDGEVNALEGISLSIPAGQKVGICGRTGSGKSTLLLALVRLLDPTPSDALRLEVDEVDLLRAPRETLRRRVVALAQEGFVLPGSVRTNLDPFTDDDRHSDDAAMEDALRCVGLWDVLEGRGGLDQPFEEGQLSQGQKQLFFVARAVLRAGTGGKVVLMDEATSSIDAHTEATLRDVLHTRFRDHTVISIAHRLDNIVDFDVVVVLEEGKAVEIGNPKALLDRKGGKFRELWDASRGGQIST